MTLESGIPPKLQSQLVRDASELFAQACSLVRDASPPWCFMLHTQHQGLRSLSSLYPLSCFFVHWDHMLSSLRSDSMGGFDPSVPTGHMELLLSFFFVRAESEQSTQNTPQILEPDLHATVWHGVCGFSRPLHSLHCHKCHRNILSIAQSWGLSLMPSWRGFDLFDKDLWTWKPTYFWSSKDRNYSLLARLAPRECCGAEPDRAGPFSN